MRKKKKKKESTGIAHIQAAKNNTIVTISDIEGNTLSWASSGSMGFRGTRKGTSFAAQLVAEKAALNAMERGVQRIKICIKGDGAGREAAIRSLQATYLKIMTIKDVTPITHNGCRLSTRRRV